MSRLDVLSEPWVHVRGAGVPAVFVHGIYRAAPSGEHHARVGRALVEGLIRRIGAELVVFEHSTHFAASEEPERFNDLLHAVWTRAMDRA